MPGDHQRALLIRQYTALVKDKGKEMAEKFREKHGFCLPQVGEVLLVRAPTPHDWFIVWVEKTEINEGDGATEYVGPYKLLPLKNKTLCQNPGFLEEHSVVGEDVYSILDPNHTTNKISIKRAKIELPQILPSLFFLRNWKPSKDPPADLSGLMEAE